jgi:hypothetical protein
LSVPTVWLRRAVMMLVRLFFMMVFNFFALQTVFPVISSIHTVLMFDALSVWAVVLIVIHFAAMFR